MAIPSTQPDLREVNLELLQPETQQRDMNSISTRGLAAQNFTNNGQYGMNVFPALTRHTCRPLWRNTTNGTTTASPVNNYFRRYVYKMIILNSELEAMGMRTLTQITALTLHITQTPTYQPYPNYRIYMINTTVSPGTDITSGWTEVYYNASQSFSTGEFTFNFNQAVFSRVTGQNLGICFAWGQSPTTWSSTGQCYIDTNSGYSSNYNLTDSAGTFLATDSATSTVSGRAHVELRMRNIFDVPLTTTNVLPGTYHSTTEFGPCANWFRRSVFKSIYTPTEIRQALGHPSSTGSNTTRITAISFFVGTQPTYQPYPDYRIGMANTSLSVGSDVTNHAQVVYRSSVSFTSNTAINFNLDTPFDWDGSSNLSISFAWGQSPTSYSASGTAMIASGNGSSRVSFTDSAGTYGINDTASSTYNYRPVLRLTAGI